MKSIILGIALLLTSLAPTLATNDIPRNQTLTYEARITQRIRATTPWTGILTITINNEGIVNGRYRSNSIRPDPFRGQPVLVSGGLTGDNIHLAFGSVGNITVRGTISNDSIIGTFRSPNTTQYDFNAVRVTGN